MNSLVSFRSLFSWHFGVASWIKNRLVRSVFSFVLRFALADHRFLALMRSLPVRNNNKIREIHIRCEAFSFETFTLKTLETIFQKLLFFFVTVCSFSSWFNTDICAQWMKTLLIIQPLKFSNQWPHRRQYFKFPVQSSICRMKLLNQYMNKFLLLFVN